MAQEKSASYDASSHGHAHGSEDAADQTTGPLFLAGCIGLVFFLSLGGGAAHPNAHGASVPAEAHKSHMEASAETEPEVAEVEQKAAAVAAPARLDEPVEMPKTEAKEPAALAPALSPKVDPAAKIEAAPMVHADLLAAPAPSPAPKKVETQKIVPTPSASSTTAKPVTPAVSTPRAVSGSTGGTAAVQVAEPIKPKTTEPSAPQKAPSVPPPVVVAPSAPPPAVVAPAAAPPAAAPSPTTPSE